MVSHSDYYRQDQYLSSIDRSSYDNTSENLKQKRLSGVSGPWGLLALGLPLFFVEAPNALPPPLTRRGSFPPVLRTSPGRSGILPACVFRPHMPER